MTRELSSTLELDAARGHPMMSLPERRSARTSQNHRVAIDRRALERALHALEPQETAVDVSPMSLEWRPDFLRLSRAWNGLRLSARVRLNRQHNNLPGKGLAFEAQEPFGTLGAEGQLTLGFGGGRTRRVALLLEPAANRVTVEVGGEMLLVPVNVIPPAQTSIDGGVFLRRASIFLKPLWADEPSSADDAARNENASGQEGVPRDDAASRVREPAISSYYGSGTMISGCGDAEMGGPIEGVRSGDLACVVSHLSDLERRPLQADGRRTADTSALRCAFDAIDPSPHAPAGEAQLNGRFIACLTLPTYVFDRVGTTGTVPEHGFEISITCEGAAPDLTRIASEAPNSSSTSLSPPAALHITIGEFRGNVRVRLPGETVRWLIGTRQPDDRPLLAFCHDGQVDVLLARASDPSAFITAPTSAVDLD